MSNSGQLKKMEIEAFKDIDCKKAAKKDGKKLKFTAMFNPEKYTKNYEVLFKSQKGAFRPGSETVFLGTKPQEYTFEFLLDGTGAVADKVEVKEKVKEFMSTVYKYEGEIHRPKYLKLNWGTEIAKCIFKKASVNYSLFNPDGTPLRATITAEFTENFSDKLRQAKNKTSSPDMTHSRNVKDGDTLAAMVFNIYESLDPLITVARANKLDSIRHLVSGSTLLFPPIEESD